MDTLRVNGVPVQKHNQLKEFFKTGVTTSNTISVEGGNTNSNYFISYSYFNQKGTVPQTDFKRHTLFSKFNTKFSDKPNEALLMNYFLKKINQQ